MDEEWSVLKIILDQDVSQLFRAVNDKTILFGHIMINVVPSVQYTYNLFPRYTRMTAYNTGLWQLFLSFDVYFEGRIVEHVCVTAVQSFFSSPCLLGQMLLIAAIFFWPVCFYNPCPLHCYLILLAMITHMIVITTAWDVIVKLTLVIPALRTELLYSERALAETSECQDGEGKQ